MLRNLPRQYFLWRNVLLLCALPMMLSTILLLRLLLVRQLRRRLQEHGSGARDHGRLLWSLLVLEHWRRRHEVLGLAS